MLILTRRIGESIMINDDIKITAIMIKGKQVSLGVEAPKEIIIHREEVYDRIKDQETIQEITEQEQQIIEEQV